MYNIRATFFLKFFISILFVFSCKSYKPEQKPNVIMILVDDMGFSDIGSYGSEINTPNLDFLASNGVRFANAYNTSKCFPSRASLITGLYSQQIGYNKSFSDGRMKNAITFGELFKLGGYKTLWAGKHHSRENPVNRGFDHFSGLFDGAANHFNPGLQRPGEGIPAQKRNSVNWKSKYDAPYRNWAIEGEIISPYTPEKDFYSTDAFTDYAINWINNTKDNNPFFLYLAYTAPHDPLMAWPEDIEKYKGKYQDGFEIIRKKRFLKQKNLGIISKNTNLSVAEHERWEDLSENEKKIESKKMQVYAAMIDRIDQNIGRLLDLLKSKNKLDNTLILFASDNGGSSENAEKEVNDVGPIGSLTNWKSLKKNWANVSNTPYRNYKNWSHEGGIKTPLIAYWPKGIINTNSIIKTPVHFIDILPTFSEIINVPYPKEYNGEKIIPTPGKSFWSYLNDKDEGQRIDPLFWEWQHGKAVRLDDWKLVSYKDNWALYNLNEDPIEENDVINQYPEIKDKLYKMYNDWFNETKID